MRSVKHARKGVSGALSIIILLQLTVMLILFSSVLIKCIRLMSVRTEKDEYYLTKLIMLHRIEEASKYFQEVSGYLNYVTPTGVKASFPLCVPDLYQGVYYMACGRCSEYIHAYYPSVPVAWG